MAAFSWNCRLLLCDVVDLVRARVDTVTFHKLINFCLRLCLRAVILNLQLRVNIVHAQQTSPSPSSSASPNPGENGPTDTQQYCASSTGPEKYYCSGSQVMHDAGGGNVSVVANCATNNDTCYAVNNTVSQQTCATCLYNPPVTSQGGGSCPTLDQITANEKTSPQSCQYFNPNIDIFNTNLPPSGIDNYVTKYYKQ